METEGSAKKIGGTIDSWCGKCKLILAHTIEAMVGDKPARVAFVLVDGQPLGIGKPVLGVANAR